MIGRLVGRLIEFDESHALVDVQGVGYEVLVPQNAFVEEDVGKVCTLHTHLVIDPNDHILCGFKNREQREMFRLLITVSGVGRAVALAILSTYSVDDIIQFITVDDATALTRVKGLGQRGAQRIILELNTKITAFPITIKRSMHQPSTVLNDAIAALTNLGYSRSEASRAVRAAFKEGIELEALVRSALGKTDRLAP